MSEAVPFARVREHLEVLEREVALGELGPLLEAAAREERSPTWLLDQLLTTEPAHRSERRVAANLKLGGIPSKKPLEDVDLEAQPSVPEAIVEELATLRFLHQGRNVLILGPTRIGKMHLAIGVALIAVEDGHRAYFPTPSPQEDTMT